MGIKLVHKHEDKWCYRLLGRHRLLQAGIFEFVHPQTFKMTRVAGAHMPYTGGWYLFDPETGEEIASFLLEEGRKFWEEVIEPHRIATLKPDPDCGTT